uniref:Uncharacterized protein n=1 Tax=Babesia bovis TaxID=5865 RepID=A7AUI0_BABBO|eukprot:XP_001610159.1 hypothetical protein [Babesia bovis T2Bo]
MQARPKSKSTVTTEVVTASNPEEDNASPDSEYQDDSTVSTDNVEVGDKALDYAHSSAVDNNDEDELAGDATSTNSFRSIDLSGSNWSTSSYPGAGNTTDEMKASMYMLFRVFDTSRHLPSTELIGTLRTYMSSYIDESTYDIFTYEELSKEMPPIYMVKFLDIDAYDYMRRRIYIRDAKNARLMDMFYFHVSWYFPRSTSRSLLSRYYSPRRPRKNYFTRTRRASYSNPSGYRPAPPSYSYGMPPPGPLDSAGPFYPPGGMGMPPSQGFMPPLPMPMP